MTSRSTISHALVTLVVVAMYLATATTGLAHRLSHGGASEAAPSIEHAEDCTAALDCFFCAHGPATPLVSRTSLPGVPELHRFDRAVALRTARACSNIAHSPQLRAPPSAS